MTNAISYFNNHYTKGQFYSELCVHTLKLNSYYSRNIPKIDILHASCLNGHTWHDFNNLFERGVHKNKSNKNNEYMLQYVNVRFNYLTSEIIKR